MRVLVVYNLMYCSGILAVLVRNLIPTPRNAEAKAFYQETKADYLRYTAEVRIDDAKGKAADSALGRKFSAHGKSRSRPSATHRGTILAVDSI